MSHFASARASNDTVLETRASRAELCLTLFLLNVFLNSGGPDILLGNVSSSSDLTSSEGSVVVQVIFILFFLAAAFIARPVAGEDWKSFLPLSMALALGWCWLSLAWATEPAIAIRRIVLLTLVVATTFSLVAAAGWERALQAYIRSVLISIPLYVLAVALLPAAVQSDLESAGAWRGLHLDKNAAGAFAANATLLMIFAAVRNGYGRKLSLLVAPLAFLMLVQSKSKTSLAVFLLAALGGIGVVLCRKSAFASYVASICIVGLIILTGLYYDQIAMALTDLTNDPTSLTGRMQIWPPLMAYLNDHLWLGSGYGSFWSIGPSSPILEHAHGYLKWLKTVPNAHNGYIEIAIQTGIIGLCIIIFSVFIQPFINIYKSNVPNPLLWLISSTVIFAIFHNLLEAIIFNKSVMPWINLLTTIAIAHNFTISTRNKPRRGS